MSRPKHRRCQVCHVVTSRYHHTENAGAFRIQKWVKDPQHGQVTRENGTIVRCLAHADR